MPSAILMLGTRRRNHFLQELRAAARERLVDIVLVGADVDDLDPFARECDRFQTIPHCLDESYPARLRELIHGSGAEFVLAWNDAEILRISELNARQSFSCPLALPSHDAVLMMCDKWIACQWLQAANIDTPTTWLGSSANLVTHEVPKVLKPRFGQGGVGVHMCRSEATLGAAIEALAGQDYLIQDFVEGTEYTVDVVCHNGHCIAAVPRRRLKVRGGEVMIAKVELHPELLELARRICKLLNQSAIFNFQTILSKGRWQVIELNPRFGGGADLSIAAGMDLAGAYLDLYLLNRKPRVPDSLKDGLHMSRRFVSEFFVPGSRNA